MALTLIVHARVPQKRLRPKGEDFSMIFDEIELRGRGSTDYYTSHTNGYAAEKTTFSVVSDSQINPK